MSKSKSHRLPPFVALTWEILNSKAYKALPNSAAKVLPYFLGKPKFNYNDPQRYREEFSLSYREAQKYGFAIATHHRSISELMKKGFIDPVDKGGLRGFGRSYNLFTLSWRWKDYDKPGFEEVEWRCFKPRYKSKVTAEMKRNSGKNGNQDSAKGKDISKSDAVEAVLP